MKFRKCKEETFNINTWIQNQLKNAFASCFLDNKTKTSDAKFPSLRIFNFKGCLISKRRV